MMFTKSTLSLLTSLLLSTATLVSAAPAPVKTSRPIVNIVYNPLITYPTAGVIWTIGETKEVTWRTDDIPEELRNSTGTILLGYNEDESENLDIAHPLATGFNLSDGKVNVTVPGKPERADYIVVLFGDSGNASPEFAIKPADSAPASATASASASAASASATDSFGTPF